MSRKHLFAIVVLLGAAAVAGLLALTRTTTAATQASSTEIAAKSRSLDRLEASLRRSLAERPPAVPTRKGAAAQSAPSRTIFVRAPQPAGRASGAHEDEHGEEHEDKGEHEGADD
jgi:hypothetical protein